MMNVSHLKKYCNDRFNKFIEIKTDDGLRWLFASDNKRAIGLKTTETSDNISNSFCEDNVSNHHDRIKELFDREFTWLDSQGFMAWLFSKNSCNRCNGECIINCNGCNNGCNNTGHTECYECDGSGIDRIQCEKCDGNVFVEVECNKCDGTGKSEVECEKCDGNGIVEVECEKCDGNGTLDDGTNCPDCEDGITEINCDCGSAKVEFDCSECEDGYIEETCEHCEDGYIEDECSYCDSSGEIECEECDGLMEVKCPECTQDVGKITDGEKSSVIDLKFLKDLSRGFFEEISIGKSERDPIIFRSNNTMAIVMPYLATSEDKLRKYLL